jgi:tRNA pseudouridine55 synthase
MTGFLIVDKPAGLTSHDVVNRIRRITGQKKAGHTGTLDPFATGVLPVALGEATKAIPFLDEFVKEYKAVLRFGICTDTQDCTGTVIAERDWRSVEAGELADLFASFLGEQRQQPPMYSALKHNGTPLYKLARQGLTIDRKMRDIVIHSIKVDEISLPEVTFTVRCSRGTYVRTLAHDIGEKAGCGASLESLQRTASGPFHIKHALSLAHIEEIQSSGHLSSAMVPLLDALSNLAEVALTEKGETAVSHGVLPAAEDMAPMKTLRPGAEVKLTRNGKLLAVAEIKGEIAANTSNFMRFLRVFN